jgi:hypothetical protein
MHFGAATHRPAGLHGTGFQDRKLSRESNSIYSTSADMAETAQAAWVGSGQYFRQRNPRLPH